MPAIASRLRAPISLRLRLTLLYGACFLAAGAGLLTITYALFSHSQQSSASSVSIRGVELKVPAGVAGPTSAFSVTSTGAGGVAVTSHAVTENGPAPSYLFRKGIGGKIPAGFPGPGELQKIAKTNQAAVDRLTLRANQALAQQRNSSRNALLTWSGIALGAMALLSIGLGWLLAGRALSPLRTMNERARVIGAENLHERLGLTGRRDELGDLAATFDALLGRLEASFDAQRRFVANASHELRTPVTLERTIVEVALANPDADAATLRRACERVLASSQQQAHVIDALLALARGQAGVGRMSPVDLTTLCISQVDARADALADFTVSVALAPATVGGDPRLLERLVANLLDNAVRHNTAGGWVEVELTASGDRVRLRVANGGERIPASEISQLTTPFHRLSGERLNGGLGLGLSIVEAIAASHGAELALRGLDRGGLEVTAAFTAVPAPTETRTDPALTAS